MLKEHLHSSSASVLMQSKLNSDRFNCNFSEDQVTIQTAPTLNHATNCLGDLMQQLLTRWMPVYEYIVL